MVRAVDHGIGRGNHLVMFTGFSSDNPLKPRGNLNFWVDTKAYIVFKMTHQVWLAAVCDLIIGSAEYCVS